MYTIARLILIVAVLLGLYCIALVVYLCWPATGWMLGILAVGRIGRRGYVKVVTTLGSARFATINELRKKKMINATSGLYLGRLL